MSVSLIQLNWARLGRSLRQVGLVKGVCHLVCYLANCLGQILLSHDCLHFWQGCQANIVVDDRGIVLDLYIA